jgi:hypothetical protein
MSLAIIEPIRQKWERQGAKVYQEAARRIREGTDPAALRAMLENRDVWRAQQVVAWEVGFKYMRAALPIFLRGLMDDTGKAFVGQAIARAKKVRRVRKAITVDDEIAIAFDSVSPTAINWIRENTGRLIREWGDSSQEGLRVLVEQAFAHGVDAHKLARLIRASGIGLTDRQAMAVERRRYQMEADGELTDAQIDARTAKYAEKTLRMRTSAISRTETIDASSAGQEESWRQALEEELLSEDDEVEWLANNTENTCDICMDLDGKRMPLGEFLRGGEFPWSVSTKSGTKSGSAHSPTAHTKCMCSIGIR